MSGHRAVSQLGSEWKALIIGVPDRAFSELTALLERYSIHLELLPEKQLLYKLARPVDAAATDLYVFNLLAPFRYDWRDTLRRLRLAHPDAGIVLVFDSPTQPTIGDAITAGADELLYRAELSSAILIRRRIGHLIPSPAENTPAAVAPQRDVAPTTDSADADTVLDIAVPDLRAPSGRLDATKVAERLGVPIARLAKVVGVSRQALSQTPDSPGAQSLLHPIARALGTLGHVFTREDERKWLHTPHQRLAGRTPLDAIMSGEADVVDRMLEPAKRTA